MGFDTSTNIKDPLLDHPTLFASDELEMDHPEKARRANCLALIVRELMTEYKVSQAEVAREAGISESTFSEWVNGKVGFQQSDERVMNLARVLNTTVDYLLFGAGADPVPGDAVESIKQKRKDKLLRFCANKFGHLLPENVANEFIELGYIKRREAA